MRLFMLQIFSLLVVAVKAQEFSMKGTVLGAGGELLPYAQVSVSQKQLSADSLGVFVIRVTAGKHNVRVKANSYKSISQKIQVNSDTSLIFVLFSDTVTLDEITVKAQKDNEFGVSRLNNVEGTVIYAGKKSEAVYVQDLNANLAANNSRQVFSKIPGINIFENEGSGTSIGIGGRGLNPNRISNFNTRQNGYDISADALGYPESYYTPPTEAVERLEILRGAAGLQFGTQFGGMINYKLVGAIPDKKFSGDFRQTGGSFGFLNSFNRISGTRGKLTYNTFYQYKHYDGWRARSQLNSHNAFFSLGYKFNDRLTLNTECTYLNYLAQQPGGLTDKDFNADATKVTRNRNWFRVNWLLPSATLNYTLNERTKFSWMTFALNAGRDALGVLGRADRADDITMPRNLLSDKYSNFGTELKMLRRYALRGHNSHFLIGTRYYQGKTQRRQGNADSTALPRFSFLHPRDLENSEYIFPSKNIAVFAENIFQFSPRWSVTPGLRYETILTTSQGYYRILNFNLAGDTLLDKKVSDDRSSLRSFLLGGIGTQYKIKKSLELYANICQNYRSINFNDMRVLNPNFQVDPNLKDESGYTADAGFRGAVKDLVYFDVSAFMLRYNNRIGTTLVADTVTFQLVRYRTNIGGSLNAGVEAFAEIDLVKLKKKDSKHRFSVFVNLAYIRATYTSASGIYRGKKVEFVPDIIARSGFSYSYKKLGFTLQGSYTSDQFSDASNAISSPSAIYGIIPAYYVVDLSAKYDLKKFGFAAGVNNLTNSKYFTRRAEGYPGPGIIPADPLNVYFTIKIKV